MWLTWGLLAFLEGIAADDVYAAVAAKQCTGAVGCEGYYRAFAVTTSPANSNFGPPSNVTGVSVAAIGVQGYSNGSAASGHLDVAGCRFKTPADTSDSDNSLSFYFGYLGLSGTWNNSTQTASVAGALAEVVTNLYSLNVWYDNDGVPGFNWDLTAAPAQRYDILNCATGASKGYDCLDVNGVIQLKTMAWTPIVHTKVLCNSIAALSTAPAGCEIHTLTTTGTNSTSVNAAPTITVVARLASQPVLINGKLHGPDRVKFDITVQFPWASFTNLYAASTAKLALIAFSAGKSAAFAAAVQRASDGDNSLLFAAAGGQSSYFAYTPTATIDGQAGTVTTQVITGQQIIDFSCPAGSPCGGLLGLGSATSLLAGLLKIEVAWLQGFGWKSSITVHALGGGFTPALVFWDPENGAGSVTNSAALAVPSLAFLVALMLL